MDRNPTDGIAESLGGKGGVPEDGPLRHRIAMTMERRAMREDWPTPAEQRPGIVARQVEIAISGTTARERTMAFRAILAADSH